MKYTIDLHTHSLSSNHAYSTLQEMATEAAANGVTAFALTDHGPALPGGPHIYHFMNMRILPRFINGVEILRGVEANILSTDGTLDMTGKQLNKLDIVLAGFHHDTGYTGTTEKEHTRAAVAAIESGLIDILCHPGNPSYPIDFPAVIDAALRHTVALEFNNSSFLLSRRGSPDNCTALLSLAREAGCYISLGSDAHISYDVGRLDIVAQLVSDTGYPHERVINSSRTQLSDFLSLRHPGQAET